MSDPEVVEFCDCQFTRFAVPNGVEDGYLGFDSSDLVVVGLFLVVDASNLPRDEEINE